MRRSTVLASLVLTVVSVLTVSTASPAQAASASEWDYVALGDSYSSGVGAPGAGGLCLQSPNSYTGLWATNNDPHSYRTVACGGATTDTLRATQLWALNSRTDLVTLTIGGNDAGFAPAVISCTLLDDAGCRRVVADAQQTITQVLPGKLNATYSAIKRRAPNARVLVLGYPILFDETAPTCGFAGMSIPKRQALNGGNAALNDLIEDRAEAAGFEFVNVEDEFAGHGACAPQAWIHGLVIVPPTNSFHPTGNGYRYGYLPALAGALD